MTTTFSHGATPAMDVVASPSPTPSPHANGDSQTPQRPSIMVIDDSPSVRKIIEAIFTRRGFHVSSFPDGISALKTLTRNEIPVPSLVLLDLGLPRMDGYEVAGLLRGHAAFEHTILLMMTAHDGMWNRLRSKIVGAQGFISKPFRVPEIVQVVCAHLKMPVPLADATGVYGSPTV